MRLLIALFFSASLHAVAQTPQVPHKLQFAGITLSIRDDARREIQKDVDAITQSPRHFNIKVERAKTYFPIIEQIFAEEGVPDDFKYLVIQESALIADAVSTSNAVGFWQFKEFTALEMGLRVDKEIDERLNIASASRGAAKYIKKNNFYFNNWVYALQAYQMGAGGVMQSVKDNQNGATHMEITSKTYWYVKKYLAHKIAYEEAVKTGRPQISLLTYENNSKKTLADLSKEIAVDEMELKAYNKWAKRGSIPEDRRYLVMIPVVGEAPANLSAIAVSNPTPMRDAPKAKSGSIQFATASGVVKINGILTIAALQGDTPAKLAERAGVDLSSFLKWNEMSIGDPIQPGQRFLLAKKRARSTEAYHKVLTGENLWSISQKYGVQQKRLRKYNRMKADDIAPGTTLWLSSMKPKDAPEPVVATSVVQIDNKDSFEWDVTSESAKPEPLVVLNTDSVKTTQTQSSEPLNQPVTEATAVDSAKTLQVVQTLSPESQDSIKSIVIEPQVIRKEAHTVQAGETLYAIAKLYKVDVMDLVRWNELDLQKGIKPGQVVKLSDSQAVTAVQQDLVTSNEIVHEVKATDTLYSVARKYGVTIKELMDWNGKKDFTLSTGEKLKVFQK